MKMQNIEMEFVAFDAQDVIVTSDGAGGGGGGEKFSNWFSGSLISPYHAMGKTVTYNDGDQFSLEGEGYVYYDIIPDQRGFDYYILNSATKDVYNKYGDTKYYVNTTGTNDASILEGEGFSAEGLFEWLAQYAQ